MGKVGDELKKIRRFQEDGYKKWLVEAKWSNNYSFNGVVGEFFYGFQTDQEVAEWVRKKHDCKLLKLEIISIK